MHAWDEGVAFYVGSIGAKGMAAPAIVPSAISDNDGGEAILNYPGLFYTLSRIHTFSILQASSRHSLHTYGLILTAPTSQHRCPPHTSGLLQVYCFTRSRWSSAAPSRHAQTANTETQTSTSPSSTFSHLGNGACTANADLREQFSRILSV